MAHKVRGRPSKRLSIKVLVLSFLASIMLLGTTLTANAAKWVSYNDLSDVGKAQSNWGASVHINGNGASKADSHWKYYVDKGFLGPWGWNTSDIGRGHLTDGFPPANLGVIERTNNYYPNKGGSQTGWWFEGGGYGTSFVCDTVGVTPVIQLDIPEREGYAFKGWDVLGSTGTWEYLGITFVEVGYGSWDNIYCSAKWEPITCTVIPLDNKNGNEHSENNRKYTYDKGGNLPGAIYKKTGYHYTRWLTNEDPPKQKSYPLNYKMTNSDIKYYYENGFWTLFWIYPDWKANTYKIVYDGNGATSGSMANTNCTYDQGFNLRANAYSKTGHHFLGWSTNKNAKTATYTDKQWVKNLTTTNNGTVTLYAVWGNEPPVITKWTSSEISTGKANNGEWSNKGYNIQLEAEDDHGIINTKIGSNSWDESGLTSSRNVDYTEDGEFFIGGSVSDNGGLTTRTSSNQTIRVDKTKPVISSFGIKYGTQANPINATSQNIIATSPGGISVYNDAATGNLNTPYGSLITWNVCDPVPNGVNKVSGIKNVYVDIYDTVNPSHRKTVQLSGASGSINVDTVTEFKDCMCLTYELHVIDNAGNETVSTKATERPIELYTSIEKVVKNGDPNFQGGTTGILHVYTTGWVDNFNMVFPKSFYQSWEYDKTKNYPTMDPTANDVFIFKDNDPNVGTYPLKGFPSKIIPTEYKTYGKNDFIRCYDFYFWVPMTINDADNPAAINKDKATWPVTTIARKRYEKITGQNKSTTVSVANSTSLMSSQGGKVTDHFKTVIVSAD